MHPGIGLLDIYEHAEERAIVALKPKPAFRALFQIATTREGSGVILYKENPPDQFSSPEDDSPCSWWRRGRVECSLFATDFGNPVGRRLIKASASVAQASPSRVES